VSEADLLPKEALENGYEGHRGPLAGPRHRAEREKAVGVTASDIMSRPPVTIGAFDLVSHAAHVMYDRKVSCLPVVDRGRLIGMVTRADVLSVFGRADADIRWEVLDEGISGEFRAGPTAFSVTVQEGVVTLTGRPETAEVGHGTSKVWSPCATSSATRWPGNPAPLSGGLRLPGGQREAQLRGDATRRISYRGHLRAVV
jgi:CBS domain